VRERKISGAECVELVGRSPAEFGGQRLEGVWLHPDLGQVGFLRPPGALPEDAVREELQPPEEQVAGAGLASAEEVVPVVLEAVGQAEL
jgi:hypothetical protein